MSEAEARPQAPVAEITLDGDVLYVRGDAALQTRAAKLFFRAVLGASPIEDGWSCPRRSQPIPKLILRVNTWLESNGFKVAREAGVARAVDRELQRRRSFLRTREQSIALKNASRSFDFTRVEQALAHYGWSPERQLRDHQKVGVAHALTAANTANFSVPGSGKTTTTLAVAVTHLWSGTIDLVVVIGPLACFDPWEQESKAALAERVRVQRVRGTAKQRPEIYARVTRGQILLLSYATAAADQQQLVELFDTWRVLLVVDESHRIKRFRGGVWAPALLELARRARVRIVLSGTPMPQSGRDLYSQLNILWPDGQLTGTRDAFAVRVDANFRQVVDDILPFVSRTPKAALGLQPYTIERRTVELSGTQAEIYELIEGRFRRQLSDAITWQEKIDTLRRARPIRLLQAAANPELFNRSDQYYSLPQVNEREPTLMERLMAYGRREIPAKSQAALQLIREIAEARGKVVCWSNFVPNLDHFSYLVRDQLGLPCFQIDGRVPAGDDAIHAAEGTPVERPGDVDTREEIIHRFLNLDGPAVLVTNPASCSESISLHRSCHNAIYLDRTYDSALFLQSIDRIHRLGLPNDVEVKIYLLLATVGGRPTIDQLVDASLAAKEDRMRQLLEGASLAPLNLSEDPAADADGDESDLSALLRFLLGENE